MAHRDYSHRALVDKLGIRPGAEVLLIESAGALDDELRRRIEERAEIVPLSAADHVDVVVVTIDAAGDPVALLRQGKAHIVASGAVWLLTPKRGQPGYVNQTELIGAGGEAGLVDNKVCSVSDTVSAMRFVIRREDRN